MTPKTDLDATKFFESIREMISENINECPDLITDYRLMKEAFIKSDREAQRTTNTIFIHLTGHSFENIIGFNPNTKGIKKLIEQP